MGGAHKAEEAFAYGAGQEDCERTGRRRICCAEGVRAAERRWDCKRAPDLTALPPDAMQTGLQRLATSKTRPVPEKPSMPGLEVGCMETWLLGCAVQSKAGVYWYRKA